MIKKIAIIVITTFTLTLNVNAGSDGDLILKKNNLIISHYIDYDYLVIYYIHLL